MTFPWSRSISFTFALALALCLALPGARAEESQPAQQEPPPPDSAMPANAEPAKPAADAPKLPPLRLDEGLILSECALKAKGPDEPTFDTSTTCVEAVLRLEHVWDRHTVRFLYYDPDGNLYAATPQSWTLGPEKPGAYHRSAWVRHQLTIAGQRASTLHGRWKVAAWLDGITVSEKAFRIEGPARPSLPALEEARKLYLELRFEDAEARLVQALASSQGADRPAADRPAADGQGTDRVDLLWWLALSRVALQRPAEQVEPLLREILSAEPSFSVSAKELSEAGGEPLNRMLEELRSREFPSLYQSVTHPPSLELSRAEAAPRLEKKRHWYQKWWFYAGVGAAAAVTTALVVNPLSTSIPSEPSASMTVVDTRRDPDFGFLCDGSQGLQVQVSGGKPPYEAIITAGLQGASFSNAAVQVPGVIESLPAPGFAGNGGVISPTSIVLGRFKLAGSTTLQTPRLVVLIPHPTASREAFVQFGVILSDSYASGALDRAVIGGPVPASLTKPAAGSRLIPLQATDVLISCP